MAKPKRKPGRQGWQPPIGTPARIDGETLLAYQCFAAYSDKWQSWGTDRDVDAEIAQARSQESFTAAENEYLSRRPNAKSTNAVRQFHSKFGWGQRCKGEAFAPKVRQPWERGYKPPIGEAKTDPMPPAKTPETFPEFVENLLLIGQRSLVLEIAQFQRVQLVIEQALEARSLDGFEAETTGIKTIDAMIAMLLNAKSAVRGAKK
jgi:hypothetical protein